MLKFKLEFYFGNFASHAISFIFREDDTFIDIYKVRFFLFNVNILFKNTLFIFESILVFKDV